MADHTNIEWTERDVEPGDGLHEDQRGLQELLCRAAGVALARDGESALRRGFRVTLHEDVLDLPCTWRATRRIFVNSMSDLFHPDVPLWFIRRVVKTRSGPFFHRARSLQ
jgi:protein gp37